MRYSAFGGAAATKIALQPIKQAMKILFRQKQGSRPTRFLIAGEGGQGIQTAAQVLAKAAFEEGKSVLYIPNFGVEQRGGASIAFLVIDKEPVVYPKFEKADILVILSERIKKRVKRYQSSKTEVISDQNNISALKKILSLTKIVKKETLKRALKEKLGAKFKDEDF